MIRFDIDPVTTTTRWFKSDPSANMVKTILKISNRLVLVVLTSETNLCTSFIPIILKK